MINFKPIVYECLCNCDIDREQISVGYPSDWSVFPVIAYAEENNITTIECEGVERIAYIRYRIDIWDKVSTSDLTIQVDNELTKIGLKRVYSADIAEPNGLQHKQLRYEGNVDVTKLKIYK